MKFIHMADCHLGGWRHDALRDLNKRSFEHVIDVALTESVDFVLIAGDFFNTAIPSIDVLHFAVAQLMRLKDCGISVYLIPGSHDFSPSGKTMLDVLEGTGLFTNVMHHARIENDQIRLRFVLDPKTHVKITGMYGRKGGLDKDLYQYINREELEREDGYTIFMFHCALTEWKPKDLGDATSVPVSCLPKGMSYYAGGHVHISETFTDSNRNAIVYPGPVFPNSFDELEKLCCGRYVIVEDGVVHHKKISLHPTVSVCIDVSGQSSHVARQTIRAALETKTVDKSIVLLRLSGTLKTGTIFQLDLPSLIASLLERGAYAILKNTSALRSEEHTQVAVAAGTTAEIEERIIAEHTGKASWASDEIHLVKELVRQLSTEKQEGEKVYDYEHRILKLGDALFHR